MKRPIRYGPIALLWLLSVCLFLASCAKNPPDYFAYREKSFTAELRGERSGSPFAVWVQVVPEAGSTALTLRYLAPTSLSGVTVTATLGQSGMLAGEADISCDSVVVTCHAMSLEGLLSPILRLFEDGELVAVTRVEEGYLLTLPSERKLTVSPTGMPIRYADTSLSFEVVWFEPS